MQASTRTLFKTKSIANSGPGCRFHDITWVQPKDSFAKGVIAGALENGSLDLWDAEKLLKNDG